MNKIFAELAYPGLKMTPYREQNLSILKGLQKKKIRRFCGVSGGEIDFQLVFYDVRDCYGFAVDASPSFLPNGDFLFYRAEVKTDGFPAIGNLVGYNADNDSLEKSDILLRDSYVFISDRFRIVQVFYRILLPQNAHPGEYRGEVRVFSHGRTGDERPAAVLPFSFEVFDVGKIDRKFETDLWQHWSNVARKHEVPLWSDAHFAIMERYLHSLAELGQKSLSIVVSDAPWCGQYAEYSREYMSDLFEYSIVGVRRRGGIFYYDHSAAERLIRLAEQAGIEEIDLFGVWNDRKFGWKSCMADDPGENIRIRYYDEDDGLWKFIRKRADVENYIGEIYRRLCRSGRIDRTYIVADEPKNVPDFLVRLGKFRKKYPRFRFKIAVNGLSAAKALEESVERISVLLSTETAAYLQNRRLKNKKVSVYTCGLPTMPNTFLRSELTEAALLPLISVFLGCGGYMRWSYTCWPQYPRDNLCYRWTAGDTCLVYPSAGGEPLLSLRYFALRRGVLDADILLNADEETRERFLRKLFPEGLSPIFEKDMGAEEYEIKFRELYAQIEKIRTPDGEKL